MNQKILYYVHDPMCSWCWGFRRCWSQFKQQLPRDIGIQYVLGGLAPDSNDPMPDEMKAYLQNTWKSIQAQIPGTEFNFDYWGLCKPRRSTYPACRAVLAAIQQGRQFEEPMIDGIQRAYYLNGKNPSDHNTLIDVGEAIGLDRKVFTHALTSGKTKGELQNQIAFTQKLFVESGASGFPSVVLQSGESYRAVPLNYNDPNVALNFIAQV